MRGAEHSPGGYQLEELAHVDLRRDEELLPCRAVLGIDGLARQAVAVRVDAGARHAEDEVAFLHAVEPAAASYSSPQCRRKSPRGRCRRLPYRSRHFRGLASGELTARLLAAGDDALDHRVEDAFVDFPAGDVIQELHRSGAADDEVVDAHRDQVYADRVVATELLCDQKLGSRLRPSSRGGRARDSRAGRGRRRPRSRRFPWIPPSRVYP